jgi:hypothetical protein
MDTVQISGNLTLYGNPFPEGLVALQLDNPFGVRKVIRTLRTGTASISGLPVNITDLFLSDKEGNPRSSAYKGILSYFTIILENIGNEAIAALVTVNFFQGPYPFRLTTFAIDPFNPGYSMRVTLSFEIPSWVGFGTATMYANVLNGTWPRWGGYPCALEKNSTFEIINPLNPASASGATTSSSSTNGSYSLALKIPVNAGDDGFKQGNYTVYVSARVPVFYWYEYVTDTTTFMVKLAGDANGDGKVDWRDLLLELAPAYGSEPGDPNWNPNCDWNYDNKVDWKDLFLYLAPFYGKTADC